MTTTMRSINYAWPPEGHFWKWSAGRDAIEWADGTTLALWPEIHAILAHLGEDEGLPPLGSLLLMLAACRDEDATRGVQLRDRLQALLSPAIAENLADRKRGGSAALPAHDPKTFSGQMAIAADRSLHAERGRKIADSIIQGLESIKSLPKDLRASLSAKCHLASVLFHRNTYNLSRVDSRKLLEEFPDPSSFANIEARPRHDANERLFIDLRALKPGIAHYRIGTLESILRTGLESPELQAPELPQLPAEQTDPRLLLDQLVRSGGESGAAAAVAKRAIAMMNFPGRFGSPRDLPVGGIADITNRGTVDRLLPGELAWDDLVLAARLVHNEALYFRREIPPQHVAVSHTVLLDRGLRLWGTARVFSLGVALGLWHHPALNGPGETFECAAAAPDGFSYLDLATPAGVRAALEVLVSAASPESFLTAWWDAARIVDDAAIPDVSFVTVREHLDDAATRRLLGEIAGWIHERDGRFRVVAIDRLGGLEVQAWSPGGNRTLFRGEIDLAEILKPQAPESVAKKSGPPPLRVPPDPLLKRLPIYSQEPLPFLFPVMPQPSAYLPEPGIGISRDRRLMRWPKPGWGGFEVISRVPGRQHWLGGDEDGGIIVIASAEQPGESVRVFRFDQNALHQIEIVASHHAFPRHAAVSGGAVVLAYADKAEAISLRSGKRLAEAVLPSLPAAPLLVFDGERIMVHDSGKKAELAVEAWSFRDNSWPRMISPNAVSLDGGVLRVKCGEQVYGFDAMKLTWTEEKRCVARFHEFTATEFHPSPEVTLKVARPLEPFEVWHDPRGLLHLKDTRHDDPPPWSILLSTPAASAWQAQWGLFSREARLRAPEEGDPGDFRPRNLQGLFNAMQATSRPMP